MELVTHRNPGLKEKLIDFDLESDIDIKKISEDMVQTMSMNNGLGLATCQVGLPYRMFVMRVSYEVPHIICINPEVIECSDEQVLGEEGCLSFPKLYLNINRPMQIKVKYFDENRVLQTGIYNSVNSRCFLHELDHLDGITFDTKVSKLALNIAKRKRVKLLKRKGK